MGLFKEYQPQAVIRAENKPLKIYSGKELQQVCKTDKPLPILFYDIFLSPDGKELIAFQAKEFSHLFLGFRVHHNTKPLGFIKKNIAGRFYKETEVILWSISLPCPHRDGIKISIEDSTGESLEADIEPYPFAEHPVTRIMQQTMQKDYPLVWVRDHILYMHRLHGIDRYVFYDNGSQDYRGLVESLQEISETEEVEIVVINWPFPRSRLWRVGQEKVRYDACAQVAAFNHGFFMLESITIYAMNLDLDEYLFNHSCLSLYTCIKIRAFLIPLILIPGVICPHYIREKKAGIIRANFYSYKENDYDKVPKYIYKANTKFVGHLDIHIAYKVRTMGFIVEKGATRQLLRFLNMIGRILLRIAVPLFREEALGYYHFRGINTGWKEFMKSNLKKSLEERESMIDTSTRSWDFVRSKNFNPEWVPFDYIKKAFKKIGLD